MGRLTEAQRRALRAWEHQPDGKCSPYAAYSSVAVFAALERKGLIRPASTLGAIISPRTVQHVLTPAGRAALAGGADE